MSVMQHTGARPAARGSLLRRLIRDVSSVLIISGLLLVLDAALTGAKVAYSSRYKKLPVASRQKNTSAR